MRRVTCLLVAFALASAEAAAQSASEGASGDPAPSAGLEEVVVTAERREANVQKVPITIQVLGADEVRASGVSGVTELAKLTTGVEIGVGGSSTQIFIRGVGDFSFNPLANPGVAFNVDGVYVARPDGLGGNLYDVERIEVLKGPQGTLYGRNANGGSINVITRSPLIGATGAVLNVELGDYRQRRIDGAVNLPLGDTAAMRAAFNVSDRDGYLSDGTNDDVQRSGRVRFRWQPSDDVSLLLGGDYSHIGGDNGGYTWLPRRPGADEWEGVGDPAAIAYRNSMLPLGPLLDPRVPHTSQDTTIWGVSAQLDWHLPAGTLTILPAYRDSDILSNSYPGFSYNQPNRVKQKSLEMRLGDSNERLTWVLGGYFFRETSAGSIDILESDIVQNTLITYFPETTAYAGFGQATFEVATGVRLIAGARYTEEKRHLDGEYIDNRPVPFGPGVGTVLERFPGRASFDGVTYKGGLEYDLTPRSFVYVTASSGFKAGGLNETVAPADIYQPEKLRALELGSRNRFFDNRLQANFGLYRWKYEDLQDQRVTFDPLGIINLIFFNIGDATIQGVTADIVSRPWSAGTFSLSVEYADSSYDRFAARVPTAVFFPGSVGCPTHTEGSDTVADCAGFQVARVPTWTGMASYKHAFTLPGDATLALGVSAKFSSKRWVATDFIAAERAGSYRVFDFDASYTSADERYVIGAFVRNIGNEAYYTGGFEQPFVPGLFAANIGAPRTYGVRASVSFGKQ